MARGRIHFYIHDPRKWYQRPVCGTDPYYDMSKDPLQTTCKSCQCYLEWGNSYWQKKKGNGLFRYVFIRKDGRVENVW